MRWHQKEVREAVEDIGSSLHGLSLEEAQKRLGQNGPNELVDEKLDGFRGFLTHLPFRKMPSSVTTSCMLKKLCNNITRGDNMRKEKENRDVEKRYSKKAFIAKLRRLADALENDGQFSIQIDGERVHVPVGAMISIEHERGIGEEEIEFQIKWKRNQESSRKQ